MREFVATQFPGRELTLALAPGLGRWRVDPSRIRLLLRNLIRNAMRHGTPGEAGPELYARREGSELLVGVRDHGPGVVPEQLPRLAEAFYRPDSARARTTGGVGLGLYLCRLVAQAHGGSLTFRDAQPGLGARLRLPATAAVLD